MLIFQKIIAKKKIIFLITLSVILLIIASVLFWLLYLKPLQHAVSSNMEGQSRVCSDQFVATASQAMQSTKFSDFTQVAEEILKKPNYDVDANCLYIVVRYQILQGDLGAATQNTNRLEDRLGKGDMYSSHFTTTPVDVAMLRSIIESSKAEGAYGVDIEEGVNLDDVDALLEGQSNE